MKNKTTQEIVHIAQEAIMYYAEDGNRRGLSAEKKGCRQVSECRYWTEEGNMCAVGRCLEDPEWVEKRYTGCGVAEIPCLDVKLKPEYRGISDAYWADIQDWHDSTAAYWESSDGVRPVRPSLDGWKEAMRIMAKAAAGGYTLP